MLGVATLNLGSSNMMAIQSRTHYAVAHAGKTSASSVFRTRFRPSLRVGCAPSVHGSFSGGLLFSHKDSPALGSFTAAVAAVDSEQIGSSDPPNKDGAVQYHFVVANAKFMLDEEEHFKELLYERRRHYGERNKEQDFWLVVEPKFLDQFPDITKRLKRPAIALVSTNGPWITFMKLRLDRVIQESFEANSLEEALASNPANLEFEKPEKWLAPYPKYEYGWWDPFLPPVRKEPHV